MRSTIVLSLLTVVSITVGGQASANSNGEDGKNGWSDIIGQEVLPGAGISEWPETDEDGKGIRRDGPCHFFESMVNMSVGTFDWRRNALNVCYDYFIYERDGRKRPETLTAAYAMLEQYQGVWKDRQVERDGLVGVWLALPDGSAEREAARKKVEALNFTDDAKKEMAESIGLLMVLEAVENGY